MFQEEDSEPPTPERIKALGFRPQKELTTNHLLPYASELDAESAKFLEQVKANLAKSVLLREMKPACGVWSSRLIKYIRIYGLKFTKEDHIAFIKLAFELVLIPNLEPCKVHKFATMFLMLAKKRHLISREELELPWRPLYDLGVKLFHSSSTHVGMLHYHPLEKSEKQDGDALSMIRKFISGDGLGDAAQLFFGIPERDENELPTTLEGSFVSMVKCSKAYFPLSATKEILAELLPDICPWSSDSHAVNQLALFLPLGLPLSASAQGHELWFDQMMSLWDKCYKAKFGILCDLMMLFAGVAKRTPGAVDWTPYVTNMFTRFLHSLNLPVSYKEMQHTRNQSLDMKLVATWIVWTINPDGVVLKQLRCFLAGIESYLHTANSGRWSYRLKDLLKKLAREFLNRVRREREKKFLESWENNTPPELMLREEDITEFVQIVLEPTLQAVYSRSGSLDISAALLHLASLRPAIVIPPLIEKLRTSLTSLTEPHRVTAAMSAVTAVARPMLRGAEAGYPEGPTQVVPLLMAVLPGLDPNDTKKSLVTLHFILIFSWMVPYIDCSSAHEYWNDLTDDELLTCEQTAQFEDFVLVFLDRLFTIIESNIVEHARLDTKESDWMKSKTDTVIEKALSAATSAVLMQCSPKIFKEALRKFKAFATDSTFETNLSGNMIGVLLRVFARVNPELTLPAFVPKLCDELTELLTDEALAEEYPPRDLVYRILLLSTVIECDGSVVLKYVPQIIPVLDRALKLYSKYALTKACGILRHLLISLSAVELKDARSCANDYSKAPKEWLPIREWGRGCMVKKADLQWHVPSKEEADCAQMLIDRYMKPELAEIQRWVDGELDLSKDRKLRCFHIVNASLAATNFMALPDEEPLVLVESTVPATHIPFKNGINYSLKLDGVNLRVALTKILLKIQEKMLSEKTDDTKGLEILIQMWERVVVIKGLVGLEIRFRMYGSLERSLDGRGGPDQDGPGNSRLRKLVADAACLQNEARGDLLCEAGITPSALKALFAVFELSLNTYSEIRMLAQMLLYWMLNHYAYSSRAIIPKIIQILQEGGEGDEWHAKHKGLLYIIQGPRAGALIAKQDWDVIRSLWPALLKAPFSEKPSILRLEQDLSDLLQRQFPTVNTRLTMSDTAVNAAKWFLSDKDMSEETFKNLLSVASATEQPKGDEYERLYLELMNELVDVAEAPNVQWRRLELAMNMISFCPSLQTQYPPRVVKLVTHSMLHDDIVVRKTAQCVTHYTLKQRSRPVKKISVDPYEIAGMERPEKIVPGYRKDIEWAIWSEDRIPTNDAEWDRPWLKRACGFYCWPEKLLVPAPAKEQPYYSDLAPEDMEEGERYLFEFFNDDANVEKLISFLTAEEKKGKDKFSGVRFSIFRLVFSHYGERIANKFLTRALKCAEDTQEAPQRFSAEISSAALRAGRYWPRDRATAIYGTALQIVKIGLTSVTVETLNDWGTCVATGVEKMDPFRGATVVKGLLEFCAPKPVDGEQPDNDTSFTVCARLYALQGVLGSLSWRGAPLAADVLNRLEAANFTQHPYQNVRETVSSLLMTIFDTELYLGGGWSGGAPSLAAFLATVRPRTDALYDENGDIVIKPTVAMGSIRGVIAQASSPEPEIRNDMLEAVTIGVARLSPTDDVAEDPPQSTDGVDNPTESPISRGLKLQKEVTPGLDTALLSADATSPTSVKHHARAVSLLTTVLPACMGVMVRGVAGGTRDLYVLAPTACSLAARGPPQPHNELATHADGFLACLALAYHSPLAFDEALVVLDKLAMERSWWARLACLDFAQPLLFYGLPMLNDQVERAIKAELFALKLMRDPRLEVRQSAAKLLTGLMHCRALPSEDKTLRRLTKSCRSAELVERHCGVLGLCAYVASRPYSLGPRLGDVLAELSRHTNAPDPIPATIRTALSNFRRTHQDDWPKHREQLTETELDLLADLTSPPSYCA